MRAADVMHSELSLLEPHSIVSRGGIAPHLIDGFALRVLPHPFVQIIFSSESSYHQNNLNFHCLVKLLSAKDTVLVLKSTVLSVCDQYWALVPPAVADSDTLQLEELCREMTMIRLVDSDSLLPSTVTDSVMTGRVGGGGGVGGDLRDRMALNARRTLLRDFETEDLDATSEYLCDAVVGTLGPHAEYNPFACPSGRLSYLLDCRSVGVNATANVNVNVNVTTTTVSKNTVKPTAVVPLPAAQANTSTRAAKTQAVSTKQQQPQPQPLSTRDQPFQHSSSIPKTFPHYHPLVAAPVQQTSAPVAYAPLTVRVRSGGCTEWDDNSPVGTKQRTNSRLTKVADTRATAQPSATPQVIRPPGNEEEDEEGEELSSDADSLLDYFNNKRKPTVTTTRGRPRKQTTASRGKK